MAQHPPDEGVPLGQAAGLSAATATRPRRGAQAMKASISAASRSGWS